jgi:hypothetical protein
MKMPSISAFPVEAHLFSGQADPKFSDELSQKFILALFESLCMN